jgi:hypothetical protein
MTLKSAFLFAFASAAFLGAAFIAVGPFGGDSVNFLMPIDVARRGQ